MASTTRRDDASSLTRTDGSRALVGIGPENLLPAPAASGWAPR
jgi:hypothetical protein